MPEGPELHLASQLINSACKSRLFTGKVRKNPIHKCADVEWDDPCYTISAVSRGKELKVFLNTHRGEEKKSKADVKNATIDKKAAGKSLQILFNFGMSGKFDFTSTAELPKHAHLSFYTKSEPSMVLSFVDPRRFGKWQVGADWAANRGPCVLFEYPLFRSNVLSNLQDSAFNKPLCEVLLNQKYFNGIGNYLRAEIIYRAGLRPFEQSRSVFASLSAVPAEVKVKIEDDVKAVVKMKVKSETPDVLQLCNLVPLEVVGLGTTLHQPENNFKMSKFFQWLQCFYKPGMKTIPDHNKRTMWYHGDPGPLVSKEGKSGAGKKQSGVNTKKLSTTPKKSKSQTSEDVDNGESEVDKPTDETPSKSRGRKARVKPTTLKPREKQTAKSRERTSSKVSTPKKGRRAAGGKAVKRKAHDGAESSQEEDSREPDVKKSRPRKNAARKESNSKSSDTESKGQKCRSRVTRTPPVKEKVDGADKRKRPRK